MTMGEWILVTSNRREDLDIELTHAMNTPTGVVIREYNREALPGAVLAQTAICNVPGVHVTDDGELVPLSERDAQKGNDE